MTSIKDQSNRSLTSRSEFIALLDSAIHVGSYRFARQMTLTWLAHFPGDLPVRLKYGQLLIKTGQSDQAVQHLTELCRADPEYLDAWLLLAIALQGISKSLASSEYAFMLADCQSAIFALGGSPSISAPLPTWADGIRQSRQSLIQGEIDQAEERLVQVLIVDPTPPLMAVTHLQIIKATSLPEQAIQILADFYSQRFPTTIAPILFQASALMDGGESDKAVALLHQSATLDVTGQVAHRLWGSDHPYENIWPEQLEAAIEIPIPAEVAALFGWNQLPQKSSISTFVPKQVTNISGSTLEVANQVVNQPPSNPPPQVIELGEPQSRIPLYMATGRLAPPEPYTPESLRSVQFELQRVASKINKRPLGKKDGRFPVYVIFTTRQGLEKQYGSHGIADLDQAMKNVAQNITARPDWRSILIYADDPDYMSAYSLSPAQPQDPWSLKLTLVDLDASLAKNGEMIGAMLIVGGPEVVPYHNLPNPVDDVDIEVPSDNPYATRDENYFVPEWPVGRLPGGNQDDAQPLIEALGRIAEHHAHLTQRRNWLQRLWDRLRLRRYFSSNGKRSSWGYTAAIWRRASLSVFRPIGAPHTMYVSPPVQSDGDSDKKKKKRSFPIARLGYFNLHGLQDSSNWYGQRDPSEPTDLPDYPIALRPQDIVNSGKAPKVVFSEACYGAHIADKKVDQAIALKFITSGTQTVVGSTCTSYGSISTPLIAADLLGHAFWKFLREGLPAGEALRRAKIHFAKEMHNRQGFLDGEDQKTLISFILIGDPLAQISGSHSVSKTVIRSVHTPATVKTVCDRSGQCHVESELTQHSLQENPPIPSKTLAQVKSIVEQYLPGMADANVQYSQTHKDCSGENHSCPTSLSNTKAGLGKITERNVVTLSKHVEKSNSPSGATHTHYHYARLTIDGSGKLIKMAVSR
jgi:tetratricopeptide (TPR) repeat protein